MKNKMIWLAEPFHKQNSTMSNVMYMQYKSSVPIVDYYVDNWLEKYENNLNFTRPPNLFSVKKFHSMTTEYETLSKKVFRNFVQFQEIFWWSSEIFRWPTEASKYI